MKVLILTAPTGQGHNAVAEALRAALVQQGAECCVEDVFNFISPAVSTLMEKGHNALYRYFPGLSGSSYTYAEKHDGTFGTHSPLYHFLTAGAGKLHRYAQEGGFSAVIATHAFAALVWTRVIMQYSPQVYAAFVATDYTCSPSVAQSRMDAYFIPTEQLTDAFVAAGVPAAKLIPAGLPVRSMFASRQPAAKARAALGIPVQHAHLLMMCGSMGCGPMETLACALAGQLRPNQRLTVVCGTNEKLQRRLTTQLQKSPNALVLGYVEDIGLLMDSADLYLTKPGGISVTEAGCKGLPMVLIDAVAGCEEYNRQYFVRLGGAVTGQDTDTLLAHCLHLMDNPEARQQMTTALLAHSRPRAAEEIAHTVLSHCAPTKERS